jgi:hypothetical protein
MDGIIGHSKLVPKYNAAVDSKSAYEMLTEKLEEAAKKTEEEKEEKPAGKRAKQEKSVIEEVLDSPAARQVGRTAASVITRSLLGALGLGGRTKRRKKTSWF